MELVVFVLAAAMVLGGALGVVTRANPVHAAMSLVLTLFGIAVMFVSHNVRISHPQVAPWTAQLLNLPMHTSVRWLVPSSAPTYLLSKSPPYFFW